MLKNNKSLQCPRFYLFGTYQRSLLKGIQNLTLTRARRNEYAFCCSYLGNLGFSSIF